MASAADAGAAMDTGIATSKTMSSLAAHCRRADILTIAKDNLGGDVIGVELEEQAGAMVYELKVLRPSGELVELRVDALTGAVVKQDDD
jgi:uncharacterized membrane protein YkoI